MQTNKIPKTYAYQVIKTLGAIHLEGCYPGIIVDELPMIYVIRNNKIIAKHELNEGRIVEERYSCKVWEI